LRIVSPIFLSLVIAALTMAMACERKEPPGAAITPSSGVALASSESPGPSPITSTEPVASATARASALSVASAAPAVDPKNESQPAREGADLEAKGKALLEAIVLDDAEKAAAFFFPREPFTPLKDSKDPDRYWKHLYRAYENDIHKLHRRRRDWTGVTFESIEPGTPPVWVPPGDEANKIGYFRSWGTKLRYRIDGQLYTVKIHTVISWQGAWYITHLLPWKKK